MVFFILNRPLTYLDFQGSLVWLMNIPSPGEWASTCVKNLKYLGLELTFQDIIAMSKRKYKELIKERIQKVALEYTF